MTPGAWRPTTIPEWVDRILSLTDEQADTILTEWYGAEWRARFSLCSFDPQWIGPRLP